MNFLQAQRRARTRLGVADQASPTQIRQAYLAQVAQFPPDRHPQEFQKVRQAYELLSNPRVAFAQMLKQSPEPLVELLGEAAPPRRLAWGPAAWKKAMERR